MNQNNENQKIDGDSISIAQKSKFLSRLDNFWFHYKWAVIISAFFLIIAIIGIVQIATKETYDVAVTFAGPCNITPNQAKEMEKELSKFLPDDYSGNGDKNVKFKTFSVYSQEDIDKINQSISEKIENSEYEDDEKTFHNTAQNAENKKSFESYTGSGECSVYIVSSYLYENLKTNNRLKTMGEIFGDNLPDGVKAEDTGVKISSLPLYKLDAFSFLPEDTYVCLLKPYIYGESSKEDNYAAMTEYFKTLIMFGR